MIQQVSYSYDRLYQKQNKSYNIYIYIYDMYVLYIYNSKSNVYILDYIS